MKRRRRPPSRKRTATSSGRRRPRPREMISVASASVVSGAKEMNVSPSEAQTLTRLGTPAYMISIITRASNGLPLVGLDVASSGRRLNLVVGPADRSLPSQDPVWHRGRGLVPRHECPSHLSNGTPNQNRGRPACDTRAVARNRHGAIAVQTDSDQSPPYLRRWLILRSASVRARSISDTIRRKSTPRQERSTAVFLRVRRRDSGVSC